MYECITPYQTYVIGGQAEDTVYNLLPPEGKACFKFIGNWSPPSPESIHIQPVGFIDPFRMNLFDESGRRPLRSDEHQTNC